MQAFFYFVSQHAWEILEQTLQHLYLSMFALLLATLLGVFLGIVLTRNQKLSSPVIGILGVIQTIPSLALLGFMLPLLGIGPVPAIIALFLYALLPIVRNTFTGIQEVDARVIEAARGMGMTDRQILQMVELPLATPVIFAGIRTAVVINVGIATLCSLIGAGGLGEYIFSGIALVNPQMTLAGAIPAALLAIGLDFILGKIQSNIDQIIRPVLWFTGLLFLGVLVYTALPYLNPQDEIIAGFDTEFRERPDGYPGLQKTYKLRFDRTLDMDPGLMYEALRNGKVDVISGFATEGKIEAYDLEVLQDDKNFFPPYFVAPVVNQATLEKYPELRNIFQKISGKIPDSTMRRLNFEVDKLKKEPRDVARAFLASLNLPTDRVGQGAADFSIGGKRFTEQYILLEMFKMLIENHSNWTVELKNGMGGTQILFDAVRLGEIDIYPEYTGTAFLVILKADESIKNAIIQMPDSVYQYVKSRSLKEFQVNWLAPLGFNNTYALMMRRKMMEEMGVKSISDLKNYLENRGK